MKLSSYIASSLSKQKGHSRSMIRLGLISVCLSLSVVIASVCVMEGFRKELIYKTFGIGSHFQVYAYPSQENKSGLISVSDPWVEEVRKMPTVDGVYSFYGKLGILKKASEHYGVYAKGLGGNYDFTFLKTCLVKGEIPDYSVQETSNQILISEEIANKLSLDITDKVAAYFSDGEKMRERVFYISGVFNTGIAEKDSKLIICDIKQIQRLNGQAENLVEGLEIKLKEERIKAQDKELLESIIPYQYHVFSAYDLEPNLFSWIQLSDTNVWVLFAIMSIVASISLISILFVLIMERQYHIGLLITMGAKQTFIRRIFIKQTLYIFCKGLILGNIIALGACAIQYFFTPLRLDPNSYYIDAVPICFPWLKILLINAACFLVAFMAILLPSGIISRIDPIKSLRKEK